MKRMWLGLVMVGIVVGVVYTVAEAVAPTREAPIVSECLGTTVSVSTSAWINASGTACVQQTALLV